MITIVGCENKIRLAVCVCVLVCVCDTNTTADNCPEKFLANFVPTNWANWTNCTEARSILPQGGPECCCKLKFYGAAYNTLESSG